MSFETWSLSPVTPPPTMLHLLILPKEFSNWEQNIQIYEPIEVILIQTTISGGWANGQQDKEELNSLPAIYATPQFNTYPSQKHVALEDSKLLVSQAFFKKSKFL